MAWFNALLCIASIFSGAMAAASGVLWMIYTRGDFIPVILGIYLIVIGCFIVVAEIINAPKLQYMMGFYVTWFGKAIVQALVGFMLIIPFVDVQDETIGGYTSISFIVSCIYNLIFAAFLIVMGVLAIFGCNSMKTIRPMMAKKKKKKGDGDDDDDDDDDDDEDEEDDGENEGDSNDSDSSSSDDSS